MSRNDWGDEKLFFRLINNKSERTYWDNISELRKRSTTEVFNRSVELTASKDSKERMIGIDVLAQLGVTPRPFYKESKKRFFELLAIEQDPEVLMSLLYAIGHNNDQLSKPEINKLCELVGTTNDLVKEGLVNALLGIDDSKAIATLIRFSTDKLNYIRDWATFGLGSQIATDNKKIRDALWDRVNDKHQDTKLEAIAGLATRKDSRVKEIIKQELLNGVRFGFSFTTNFLLDSDQRNFLI